MSMRTPPIERTEILQPEPAQSLAAVLGVDDPGVAEGAGLPLMWHWLYLLDRPAQADLGEDGHPVRAVLPLPPEPGRRRMWAGGRVRAHTPLVCGMAATRRTQLLDTVTKQGRSGPLTFVTVSHQITQGGTVAITEELDIVYRPKPQPGDGRPAAASEEGSNVVDPEPDEWVIPVTPPLLFRFSALTYNAHRIHYDRDYARDVEGYPGLVVHGPLQVLAMAEAVRRLQPRTNEGFRFEYRLVSPLFEQQGMVVRAGPDDGDGYRTSVSDHCRRRSAEGHLVPDHG
jgi:3-methylfumaryl-CoA hydratase